MYLATIDPLTSMWDGRKQYLEPFFGHTTICDEFYLNVGSGDKKAQSFVSFMAVLANYNASVISNLHIIPEGLKHYVVRPK